MFALNFFLDNDGRPLRLLSCDVFDERRSRGIVERTDDAECDVDSGWNGLKIRKDFIFEIQNRRR